MGQPALLLHASLVTSVGVLAGVPYWQLIVHHADATRLQSWRVAHAFLAIDGMLMLVLGLAMPHLALTGAMSATFVLSLIVSGWGFVLAFLLGALTLNRGLSPTPFGLNTLCFVGHAVGSTGSLIALGLAVYGLSTALP